MNKKIVYVDLDDVLCDYSKAIRLSKRNVPEVTFPQSIPGFFQNLLPIKQGIETVNKLRQIDLFDVYILTAPSVLNAHCYTEKRLWVERHFDLEMVNKLILSPNKGLNKGDYLIDDHTSGRGQEMFEGKLLHFGSESFRDWPSIWEYFKKHYRM